MYMWLFGAMLDICELKKSCSFLMDNWIRRLFLINIYQHAGNSSSGPLLRLACSISPLGPVHIRISQECGVFLCNYCVSPYSIIFSLFI